ncbi:hypothetical protein [Thalassotalea profundi]|uniref:Transporter n=1 Tax=Thalassotalea profundi TaxID=2036687 RepID=A0ABQ3IH82_9GAMM|nr:hypothetical protein [Thalassotalea profundi]GHE83524.1 hypothetical protein GCM10011501_10090 [Thalassotalea profundi]
MLEIYIALSVVIGLVDTYGGYITTKNNGVVNTSGRVVVLSFIGFFWAITSAFALFTLDFQPLQLLIPVLYLTHNILGWCYGIWIVSKIDTDKLEQIKVPLWYAKFCFNFGIVFTLCSIFILLNS